jgi:LytS/YehU family sensor histidine kinase
LNSIRVLIADDPAAAEQMVLQLSALLRASLDAADSGTVALERELDLTVSYLEIEKTRFDVRFDYAIDVPPQLMRAAVPPFALQTLVENSVKFGGAAIRVQARADAGRLGLDVCEGRPDVRGDRQS